MSDRPRTRERTHVADLNKRDTALIEVMIDLFRQGQKSHHENFPEMFGPAEDDAAIAAHLSCFFKPRNPLRKRSNFAKGWFVDGTLSGYLLFQLYEASNVYYGKTRWTCFVEDIVIDEAARGKGGASALMGSLLAEIERLDECAVSGTVWSGNDASIALFEKHGFHSLSQSFCRVVK